MAFCFHCGAKIPDGVTFCPKCGQTQPASSPEVAGDLDSLFVEDPQPGMPARTAPRPPVPPTPPAYTPPPAQAPMQMQMPPQQQYAPAPKQKKKKGGKFILVLLLLIVLAAVAYIFWPRIIEFTSTFQNRPESVVPESVVPESVVPESDKPESVVPGSVVQESVVPETIVSDTAEDEPEEETVGDDELTPEEWITYLKALLGRSEAQLEEELAKGAAADPEVLKELQTNIPKIREEIRKREQND